MPDNPLTQMRVGPVAKIVLAWLIFAFWGVLAREIDMPLPIMLFLICLGGTVACLPFAIGNIHWNRTSAIIAAILMLDLVFLFAAFQRISFATTIALHYAGPIVVVALSPLTLGEQFNWKNLLATIAGFCLVVVLVGEELSFFEPSPQPTSEVILGVALALLSAVTLAANILLIRKNVRFIAQVGGMVFQYNLFMSACFLILIPFWIGIFSMGDPDYLASVTVDASAKAFGAGILTQGIGMLLFNSAARHLDSQTIARMSFLEVAFVIALGSLIYNEALSVVQVCCIILIMIASYLAKTAFHDSKRHSLEQDPDTADVSAMDQLAQEHLKDR